MTSIEACVHWVHKLQENDLIGNQSIVCLLGCDAMLLNKNTTGDIAHTKWIEEEEHLIKFRHREFVTRVSTTTEISNEWIADRYLISRDSVSQAHTLRLRQWTRDSLSSVLLATSYTRVNKMKIDSRHKWEKID